MNLNRNLLVTCALWLTVCFNARAQSVNLNLKTLAGIEISGPLGSTVAVESSTNLDSGPWTELTRLLLTNETQFWIDLGSTNKTSRFYRAAQVTNAVPPNPNPERLVWIPAGAFVMGSPSTEQDRLESEGPQTTVIITKGYWISKFETTQEEYLAIMGYNPSSFTGDSKRPVEQVLWSDATNFCAKVTAWERAAGRLPDGYLYRLPTEAEWEYACRAGTTNRYSFGDNDSELTNYAWCLNNSGSTTHPVGTKSPNPWGLYDMHGNVWEWCQDWWSESLPGGTVLDPWKIDSSTNRILRGGSWYGNPRFCRSAARDSTNPGYPHGDGGFRVILAPLR